MVLKAELKSNIPVIGLLFSIVFIQNYVARYESLWLIAMFGLAFVCYLITCSQQLSWQRILVWGILIRISFLWLLPTFSDDFYRFFWDGQLSNLGINPYLYTPEQAMEQSNLNLDSLTNVYSSLNSVTYRTIYPPVAQIIFWFSSYFNSSTEVFVAAFRTIQIAVDVAIFFLIKEQLKYNNDRISLTALYFLNPLVILELTGNLHLEGLMLLFILLSIKYYNKNSFFKSGSMLGLGVATKLIPLAFLPALLLKSKVKNFSIFISGFLLIILLTTLPFWDFSIISGIKESSTLFVNKFEFNASVYFLMKAYGYWDRGFNTIATSGPTLTYFTLGAILLFSLLRYKTQSRPKLYIEILLIYLTFALVVHPWYVIPLIGLTALTNYRFPILWSFLVMFSYIGYSKSTYEHPYVFIVIEYIILWSFFTFELFHHPKNESLIKKSYRFINNAF
jgi:alpha-1,6-mannosyltransferase